MTAAEMNLVQSHRGPDDSGYYFDPEDEVTLAMRRLAIQDRTGGHQPMSLSDQSLTVVFNGEIFNAPYLRAQLIEQGIKFASTNSDTEVLLHLYRRDGAQMVRALNGMFAFVIHDRNRRRLFGARDRAGIKPLNYAMSGGRFSFASELRSLRVMPWVSDSLSNQAIFDFFSLQFVPAPQTSFKEILKLPPAHYFELSLTTGELRLERYWEPDFRADAGIHESDLPEFVRLKLTEAVNRWLLSDVPVAFSLSGGLDSSSLVAIAAKALGAPVSTYSLGFKDAPDIDETHLARSVAKMWGTTHTEVRIDENDLLEELRQMVSHLEEPYAGGLPSWFVFREMASEVKVGIVGTGGDELFGNYGKWAPYVNLRAFGRRLEENFRSGCSIQDLYTDLRAFLYPLYFRDSQKRGVFTEAFLESLKPSERFISENWAKASGIGPRNAIAAIDFYGQLSDEFLLMTDRFSMAHSIEARTPFLDNELVGAVFSISDNKRTHLKDLKGLLRRAVTDLLPKDVLSSPKQGFVLPQAKWLRGGLRSDVDRLLGPAFLREQGIFATSIHEEIVLPFLEGKHERSWPVWTLFMFQLWFETLNETGSTK